MPPEKGDLQVGSYKLNQFTQAVRHLLAWPPCPFFGQHRGRPLQEACPPLPTHLLPVAGSNESSPAERAGTEVVEAVFPWVFQIHEPRGSRSSVALYPANLQFSKSFHLGPTGLTLIRSIMNLLGEEQVVAV